MMTKNDSLSQWLAPLYLLPAILILAACAEPAPSEPPADIDLAELTGETESAPQPEVEAPPTLAPTDTPSPVGETPVPTVESPTETPAPTAAPEIHIVAAGENLTIIADYYGVSLFDLMNANGISDQQVVIYIGQEIIIPSEDAPPPQPTATAIDLDLPQETAAAESADTPAASPTITGDVPGAETPEGAEDGGESPEATAIPRRQTLHNGVACPVEITGVPAGATLVGRSAVCGLPIISYQLGSGPVPLVLVGGIHGGYEWNTITLAHEMLGYLQRIPGTIPDELTVYVIPNANPDGLYAVSGKAIGSVTAVDMDEDTTAGRFNGRNVDLNRNWDCQWRPDTLWRDQPTSGGEFAFSEVENVALRDFITARQPAAVLFWHSAATGVYASGCGTTDPASLGLAQVYSQASTYPLYESFEYYDITGDAGDYLAAFEGIPSISVELTDHFNMNWQMNLDGLTALMRHLAQGGSQ